MEPRLLATLVIGVIALAFASCDGERPSLVEERREERQQERQEDRRKGFHCLSPWNGHHDGFERLVRGQLNDPDSLRTDSTAIVPAEEGVHIIRMEFGAKNAFVLSISKSGTDRDPRRLLL